MIRDRYKLVVACHLFYVNLSTAIISAFLDRVAPITFTGIQIPRFLTHIIPIIHATRLTQAFLILDLTIREVLIPHTPLLIQY